jgi:hypothetical protein
MRYAEAMNTLYGLLPQDALAQRLQPPFPLIILAAPFAGSRAMLEIAARLALYRPLRVLDGGNRFNAREVAQQLRHLNAPDLYRALSGIQVRRAFTCYQMTALLEDTSPSSQPSLVIDLLDTFYDESAPLPERRILIERCMQQLRNLSSLSPTIASVRPPQPSHTDPTGLLEIVQNASDLLWLPEEEAVVPGSKHKPPGPPLKLF